MPAFIADGGFAFLHDNKGEGDDDEQSVNSDSNFDDDEEEAEDSAEASDFSGDDDGAKSSDIPSSAQSELSDQGTTLEEMEREERRLQQAKMNGIRNLKKASPHSAKQIRPQKGGVVIKSVAP